jgi:hypothetical protein
VRVGIYNTPAGTGPVTVQNNHVHHVYQKACAEGGAGLLSDAYSTPNAVVHFLNNHVHDVGPTTKCNTVHGIYLSTNGDAVNNLSYRNSGWGVTTWHDAKANNIQHNTVHANLSGGISAGAADFYHPPQPWTGSLVNNIAVDNAEYGILLGGGGQVAPNQVVSNNVMSGNPTKNYLNNSGVAGGACQNCSESPPVFAGTGDWHLKAGSPGLDQAAASNVRQDIDGISRPQASAADVGAYETTSGPPPTPAGGGNASIVFVPAGSCTGLPNGAAYNAAGTVKVCP